MSTTLELHLPRRRRRYKNSCSSRKILDFLEDTTETGNTHARRDQETQASHRRYRLLLGAHTTWLGCQGRRRECSTRKIWYNMDTFGRRKRGANSALRILTKCTRYHCLVATSQDHGQMAERLAQVLDVLTRHKISSRLRYLMLHRLL
jgi:hypothetical protein